jgi:predicted alpha/beta-fold hydrolase
MDNSSNQTNVYSSTVATPFPLRPLAAPDIQTILARHTPRSVELVRRTEQPMILDAGPDETGKDPNGQVRLHGYYNRSPLEIPCRGLVAVLHGWEGSSHAAYSLVFADNLLRAGFDVFRLNLRDHGPNLHIDPYRLNRGIFMGSLIHEAHHAVSQIALLARDAPFYILGPSLGGNFVLRMALLHAERPIANLRQVIAINPAVDPAKTLARIQSRPLYLRYFRKRWLQSLAAKSAAYPELYDIRKFDPKASLYELTEIFVREYTPFESVEAYFDSYTVRYDAFENLTVSTRIITAIDDAIVPVTDFYCFAPHPLLNIEIMPSGGHVGYMNLWPLRHVLPDLVLAHLGDPSD